MDVTIVVRTQGERTEALCVDALQRQFGPVVHVVRVSPLAEAVRECMRIGMAGFNDWLLTVDADILPAPNLAQWAADCAAAMPARCWQALGCIDDKLGGFGREGGARLWRVSHLAQLLPAVRNDALRPEAALVAADPEGLYRTRRYTGRHDYEQFYADLHRKGAAHRVKHPSWRLGVVPAWHLNRSGDRDLHAAWLGWHGLPVQMKEKGALGVPGVACHG